MENFERKPVAPDSDPVLPTDPDPNFGTTRVTATGTGMMKRFRFKRPKFPDYSELKSKALKTQYKKTASQIGGDETEEFEAINVKREKEKLELLASQSLTVPDGDRKKLLNMLISEQRKRVDAARELSQLLPASASSASSDLADRDEFSAGQIPKQKRIRELKDILFPPRNLTEPIAPSEISEEKPKRFYRPSRHKSIYLEKKEEEKDYGSDW